ncbi:MAG: RNA polymerase factor sigma-54 [Alphaproteobacteria bacterium]
MNKITQSLDLRQSQSLVMTPQLQQAIKLLQLNNMELSEFIEEELERNPLLEKDDTPLDSDGESPSDSIDSAAANSTGDDNSAVSNDRNREGDESDFASGSHDDMGDTGGAESDFDAGVAAIGAGGSSKFDDPELSFENRLTEEKSLREYLQDQLYLSVDDGRDRMIGAMMIDQLDENGYLRDTPLELAEKFGCKAERVERLLQICRGFDPTGVFAADLKDCLALQLEERGTLDTYMRTLLDNLELIARFEHKKLADLCGVNETFLGDMIGELRACNPKPAAQFEHLVVQTAIPDVLMKRLPRNLGGGWRVELNHETLPRVLINQDYYAEIKSASGNDKASKEYITTQMNNASWLIKAMDQRAKTILRVASEIIEEQDAFFNYGIEFLRPMKLADIAEKIDMHESTVSRVTTNKYIGTPRGIFELKFFFTTGVGGEDGGLAHSSEAIKAKIKNLIDAENPKKILSDDKIVELLKAEGIDIARRTVAKYREAMHIGSSVERRRQKAFK